MQVLEEVLEQTKSNETSSILVIEAHFEQLYSQISAALNQRYDLLTVVDVAVNLTVVYRIDSAAMLHSAKDFLLLK